MLSEELEQAKVKFLLDIKGHPHMDCGKRVEECLALRTIYRKDEDMPHALWANYELRKALNEEIKRPDLSPTEVKKMLKSYWQTFLFAAPYDFHSFLLYMEKDREPEKKFYPPRMKVLRPIVRDLQDLADGKLNVYGLSLPPGSGKAQPLYSKVLTPTGFKNMGDVHVGDQLISGSGEYCHAIGVFPQGIKDVYRVVFNDGTSTECCKEHIWHVQTRDDRRKSRFGENGRYRDIQLQDMMKNLHVENGHRLNYSVDYVKPVEFIGRKLPLHPYIMGVLLGDGSLSGGNLSFVSADSEIVEKVSELLPDGDILDHKCRMTYRIKKSDDKRDCRGFMTKTKTQQALERYGLIGSKSESKSIPNDYMIASVEDRWELLRGLLDTDGYAGGCCIEYTTVSRRLCQDVMSLVRSLGGRATATTKTGSYRKNGKLIKCRLVYKISIIFNNSAKPFFLTRKSNSLHFKRNVFKKFIDHVEYVGKEKCQCIMVDDPSQLYVTDDFIITHNTTLGILYMTWLMGRNPDMPSLASAYADKLCRSFYDGAISFIKDPEYKFNEIFPSSPLAVTNAKDETIDLARQHRFKTLTCRSIDGGLTGATRCESLLYADDMVSGSEEALNRDRMDTLWTKFTNDLMSRMKENCKMLVIGTRWSVWDPLGRLEAQYEGKKKAKFVKIPALDINGNSNFEYKYGVGFSTKHFKMLKDSMDDISWRSIYQQEPIEREGVLYHEDDLQYFNGDLPKDKEPDAIVAVCDSKGQGRDYVSAPCGVIYGDLVYIPAWVFNNGLPDVTKPLVANMCLKHNVSRLDVEMNNGGDYYADGVNQLIRGGGGYTSIREFFTSTNKITKIVTESDFVKKHFVFLNPQSPNTPKEYKDAMRNVLGFTVTGKSKHDDAPDSLAMLSQLVKDLSGMEVRIVDRRSLPL